jgi:hypothetical protein
MAKGTKQYYTSALLIIMVAVMWSVFCRMLLFEIENIELGYTFQQVNHWFTGPSFVFIRPNLQLRTTEADQVRLL